MSIEQVRKCDRCRYISPTSSTTIKWSSITVDGESKDFCPTCEGKFKRFMSGSDCTATKCEGSEPP